MSAVLVELAASWWRWIAGVSLQGCVLFAIAVVVERALGRRAWPELRLGLWLLVVLRLLLPPTLSSPVSVARLSPDDAALLLPRDAPAASGIAFTLWLFGVLSLSVVSVLRHRRGVRAWLGAPSVPPSPPLGALAKAASRKLGLRTVPPILVSRGVRGPAVVGVLRPTVVLPAELLRTAESARLEHVLLHELAHVKRRDPLLAAVVQAVHVAYWFHPVSWWASRRLATLREVCCDRSVARALGGETTEYRRTLLELARPALGGSPAALAFIHPHSQLLSRLEFLDRPILAAARLRLLATVSSVALVGACCLPLAAPPPRPVAEAWNVPPLEELEGCLQLRHAVLATLAERQRSAQRD